MKKVIHVFGKMDLGGAETRTMEIFRNINKEKVMFDFLVMKSGEGYYDKEIERLGGRIIQISDPSCVSSFKHMTEIISAIKNNGPFDAIHAHTSYHTGIVVFAAFFAGTKIRVTHSRTANNINNRGLLRKCYFFIMRILIMIFATNKVACGLDAANFLYGKRTVKKGKVKIIYNAIDINRYVNLVRRNVDLRCSLGFSESDYIIGHVGRFNEVKNHRFIVSILEKLNDKNMNYKFVFVGDGPLRCEIEELISALRLEKYVTFLGVRNDIPQLMSMLDLFILPSLYEGIPGVILEAQAAETECLASDTITKEVDLGLNMVEYIPLGNIDAWVNNILNKNIKQNSNSISTFRAFKTKGFTVENSIKEFYSLYQIE